MANYTLPGLPGSSSLLPPRQPDATAYIDPATIPDGKTMVDASTAAEAVKVNQQARQAEAAAQQQAQQETLNEAARRAAIRQDPTLNYIQRELVKGLLGQKLAWDAADRQGDMQGRSDAEATARSLREQADAMGFDASAYGAGVTLKDAAQALANNDARAVSDMFYGSKSGREYYNDLYNRAIEAGVDEDYARERAGREAGTYQSERLRRLNDAFQMYGIDERGQLTQNGVNILGMVAGEGGDALANLYANMYVSPSRVWDLENSINAAAMAEQNARGRMGLKHQYGQAAADAQQRRSWETSDRNVQLGLERNAAAVQQRYSLAKALGYPEEEARGYALTGSLPKPGKSGSQSGNGEESEADEKVSRATMGVWQNVGDAIEQAEKAVQSGAALEDDNHSVAEACEAIEDAISKGHIAGSKVTDARNVEYYLQYIFNVKSGNKEKANEAASYITGDYWDEHLKDTYGKQPGTE